MWPARSRYLRFPPRFPAARLPPPGEAGGAPGWRLVTVAEAGSAAPLRATPPPSPVPVPSPARLTWSARRGCRPAPPPEPRRQRGAAIRSGGGRLGSGRGPRTRVTSRNSVIGAGEIRGGNRAPGRGNGVVGAARRGSASPQGAVCGGRKLPAYRHRCASVRCFKMAICASRRLRSSNTLQQ